MVRLGRGRYGESMEKNFAPAVVPLAFAAGLTLVAGCSGGAQPGFSSALPASPLRDAARANLNPDRILQLLARTRLDGGVQAVHRNRRRPWMSPDADRKELLYASDAANGTVDVYDYRNPNRLLGQLTGFQLPYGECSDRRGQVYVADFGALDVVEFDHGQSHPLRTIKDTGGYPIGCSVDPLSGNLAISNFADTAGVEVYPNASGQPESYEDTNFVEYWPPGYDNAGNLFVEGLDASGNFRFAELPAGGSGFLDITLDFSAFYPGSVMYDGTYMALTDQEYGDYPGTGIYRVNVEGERGIGVGAVEFVDNCSVGGLPYTKIVQPWIQGGLVVGGDLDCTSRFGYWSYENGGYPLKAIPSAIAPVAAYAQTVSK